MSPSQKAHAPKRAKPTPPPRRLSSDAAPPTNPPPLDEATRSERERDQLDLIAHGRKSDAKLAESIVTAFSCSDGRVLVAFGELLSFVASHARGRR
jgi:hypothetical protein